MHCKNCPSFIMGKKNCPKCLTNVDLWPLTNTDQSILTNPLWISYPQIVDNSVSPVRRKEKSRSQKTYFSVFSTRLLLIEIVIHIELWITMPIVDNLSTSLVVVIHIASCILGLLVSKGQSGISQYVARKNVWSTMVKVRGSDQYWPLGLTNTDLLWPILTFTNQYWPMFFLFTVCM